MQGMQWRIRSLIVASLILGSCTAIPDTHLSPGETSVPLRVMAFNIELGGAYVSFDSVIDAIRVAEPDIVAIQEPYGQLPKLAERLGWHYDLRNHVVSKFPLIDPPGAAGHYVLAEVLPGRVVAVASVHLPSDPYGEDWIRDGRSHDEVVELERAVRLPSIRPFLAVLPALAELGLPVFMAGDFNSPPGGDWQPESIAKYPFRRFAVDWPVARAITDSGLRDSYRDAHPDVLARPGFTWWAARPPNSGYDPEGEGAWQSRIDFIWYAGPARVTNSRVVGEPEATVTDIAISPWPSDHRALISDFAAEPLPVPVFIALEQRVVRPDTQAVVRYNNTTDSGYIEASRIDDESMQGTRIDLTTQRGQVTLPGIAHVDGEYRILLHDAAGAIASENRYWYQGDALQPRLVVKQESADCETGLVAKWNNAPGHRYDWLGVFGPDDSEPRAWLHIDAAIDGEVCLDANSLTGTWPSPPGRYVLRLMLDDSYQLLAESATFQIN